MNKNLDHIIWISDIHIKSKAKEGSTIEDLFENFAEVFRNKILSLAICAEKITYVIVTGDISFSSEDDQYINVKTILKSLIPSEYQHVIKFIWCSGNHDASWEGFEMNYHKLGSNINTFFRDRNKSFNGAVDNKKIDFDNIFQHYSKNLAYKNNLHEEMFNIESTNEINVSKRYYDFGLEGQIIDNKQKIIFTIINTAWFSRGHSLQRFLTDFGKELSQEDQLKLIEESQESGRLITGLLSANSKLNASDLLSILEDKKHDDYMKITLMHHPMDWLNPSEIHSYKPNMQRKGTVLTQIFRASSVLLTGHVHPSRANRIEYLYDLDLIHLRAPMLINHYGDSEDDVTKLFPCNGFGVFTIDRRLQKYSLQYYDSYFSYDSFEIMESNETPNTTYIKGIDNKDKTLEFPGKRERLDVKYSDIDNTENFNFEKFAEYNKSRIEKITGTKHLNLYHVSKDQYIEILTCPKDKDCFLEISNMKSNDFEVVKELTTQLQIDKKISKLTILIPGNYLKDNNPQIAFEAISEISEYQIQKNGDKVLNRLRTNFFNYIESEIEENEKIQEFFSNIETCQFNIALMKSSWFS